MTNEQLWQAIQGEIELCISKASFTTWFRDTSISSKSESEIIVSVPNGFAKEWLENKYHKFILKAAQGICPKIIKIIYKIGGSPNKHQEQTKQADNFQRDATQTIQEENIAQPSTGNENGNLNKSLSSKYNFDISFSEKVLPFS